MRLRLSCCHVTRRMLPKSIPTEVETSLRMKTSQGRASPRPSTTRQVEMCVLVILGANEDFRWSGLLKNLPTRRGDLSFTFKETVSTSDTRL